MKIRFVWAMVISLFLTFIQGITYSASALTSVSATGTSPAACNQTGSNLGNAGDVMVSRSTSGDCIISFLTTGITYGWTVPTGVTTVSVLVVGGGGGGSGCCNGGYSGAGGSGVAIFRYPANAGLSLAISGTPLYRVNTTITASANIEGRVSFFANGRIIPGCRNLSTTAKSVSCTWKPALHGKINITGSISSTTYSGYTGSATTIMNSDKRSNSR